MQSPLNLREFSKTSETANWKHFTTFTADCTDAILDGDVPWRLDPDLFSPELLDSCDFPQGILTEVMHIMRTRLVDTTGGDLERLEKYSAFLPSTWSGTAYGKELASQIAVGVSGLGSHASAHSRSAESEDDTGLCWIPAPRRRAAASGLNLRPGTRLITAPFLWEDGGESLIHLVEQANEKSRPRR